MANFTFPATLLLAACVLQPTAAATTVYRCGNSYSQVPCDSGTALPPPPAKPSAADAARAAAATKRDARLADEMEKERLRQEAKAAPALVMKKPEPPRVAASAAPQASAHGKGRHPKAGKAPEHFTAVAPKK